MYASLHNFLLLCYMTPQEKQKASFSVERIIEKRKLVTIKYKEALLYALKAHNYRVTVTADYKNFCFLYNFHITLPNATRYTNKDRTIILGKKYRIASMEVDCNSSQLIFGPAGIFCRLQVAGCGLKFNYNWKTAGTKDTHIHQGFLHNVVGVFHMVKTRATSSFGKYIQQPFQMIFQMFSGYFR